MVDKLMTLLNVGEEWVLYLLFAVSIVCVALIIERAVVLHKAKGNLEQLKDKLLGFLSSGNMDGAKKYFSSEGSGPAAMASAAFAALDRSPEALQESIEAEVTVQRMKLERGLDFLGSVGSNAPFVGLFGTVLGIIQAFQALAHATNAEPTKIMAGIASALVATAVGLGVAIPALVAYNYYKGIVRDIMRAGGILCKPLMSYSLDKELGRPVGLEGKKDNKKAESEG